MSLRKGPRTRRDCTHPTANHQHGTALAYTADRCRCNDCTDAVAAEAKRIRRLKAYGRYDTPNWVDAEPIRQHVRQLMHQGHTVQGIATCAGVDMNRMRMLLWGNPSSGRPHSTRIRGAVAERLMTCRMDWRQLHPNTSIDSTGTIRRIRALGAIGWSGKHIADLIGMRQGNLAMIQSRPQVLVSTALKVDAVYHRLSMTPAPDNQYTRRLRTMSAAKGWAPPLAWDDATIDDPDAVPDVGEKASRHLTVVEDAEHLISQGVDPWRIHEHTGHTDPANLRTALRRADRHDLANRITPNPWEHQDKVERARAA